MKFTLLFYTNDWEIGPAVELGQNPQPGSVIWVRTGKRDEEGSMYYVDNIMYPEIGLEREDVTYLYVRPYEGYGEYAPRTETDRLAEKLDLLAKEVKALRNEVSELNLRAGSIDNTLSSLASQVEDKQQEIAGLLDEAVSDLGYIKETI